MRPFSSRPRPASGRRLATAVPTRVRAALLAALVAMLSPALTAAAAATDTSLLPADGADFRAARWGMSRTEVRRTEPAAPELADGPLLVFPATVAGRPCRVVYFFQQEKLCMGFYQWSDTHEELGAYFADAEALRAELTAAYDEPPIEKWDWEDPMFAAEPELRAEALGLGLVRYELGWMNPRSILALRMCGGDLKADIVVMYADRRCFPTGQDAFGAFFSEKVGVPSPYYR